MFVNAEYTSEILTGKIMGNDTLFHQALTLEYEGRFAEARELFQRCFADPAFDEGNICFHCGWCFENEKERQQALVHYAKAAQLTRIPSCKLNSFFRSGWILMHEKDYAKAADMFRYAIDYGELVNLRDEAYQHAMYWYAVCLESQERFLEALSWYRIAQGIAPRLDPESRFRQIVCLNRIGLFAEAVDVCRTFDAPFPEEFDRQRSEVLRREVRNERNMLEACLMTTSTIKSLASYAIS
jgi:tetratricopeptide (TPR) repeat protein